MAIIKIPENVKELIIPRMENANIAAKIRDEFILGLAKGMGLEGKFQFDPSKMEFVLEDKKDVQAK